MLLLGEHKCDHMPNCERLKLHLIGVPFHPFIDDADVAAVIEFLRTERGSEAGSMSAGTTTELCVAK
jgi:hypothetical protein